MERNLIGMATDDLRLPVKAGLSHAAALGFAAVEIGAATEEVNPRELSASGRRHLRRHVANLGLRLASLGADPTDASHLNSAAIDRRADETRAVLEMAAEVGAPIVTVRLGTIIDPASGQASAPFREFLEFLGGQADRVGAVVALRLSADDPRKVAELLEEINCPALRVCLDPAAALLAGRRPPEVIESLAARIGLSHVRDAAASGVSGLGRETILGRGEVDCREYLAALEAAGYAGAHIVRRTDSQTPAADLAASKEFLESLMR